MNNKKPKKKATKPFIEGSLFVTRKGVGYVSADQFAEDIEIAPHKLNTALHGDTVEILVHPKTQGRRQGEVTKVLLRAHTKFVGTIEEASKGYELAPEDDHIPQSFTIKTKDKLPDGYKAYGEIVDWGSNTQPPTISILEILGKKGDHETETRALLLSHDIDTTFPKSVEDEAETLRKNHKISLHGRTDMRDRTTFTIDPKTAKDFDDALSFKKLEGNLYEIGIHIADVSHFVKPGSELDREAKERAFSVYLVDRTIPMLPEALSNDLCSLNPQEEKYAFSAIFHMDIHGTVHTRTFAKTVIKSDKRFTYEEAQEVLDGKSTIHKTELETLDKIAHALRKDRYQKGAIDFDTEEVEFELDENKKPIRIIKKERLETMRMIEDFMLLANREVAQFLAHQKDMPVSVYRVHDKPNPEKLEALSSFLHVLGYDKLNKLKDIKPKDIQKLIQMAESKPEAETIKTVILRSMAKATYTTTNIGHFGLAFDYYTHFTSPIRRYPDLMVHRILHDALTGARQKKDLVKTYENILRKATDKEIAAMEAERDSIRMKQVEYMKEHIGEIFTGKITGVTEWGVYIEENETKAEGMVRVRDLGDDYFSFDEKSYAMKGSHTHKKFALGDKVKVRLVGVNVDDRTIDWSLV